MFIDKLAWILIKDHKVLNTLSKGKDTWYLPGGKRAFGESDIEALTREIREKLDVELIEETIEYFGVFEAPAHGNEEVVVRMVCYIAEYCGILQASAEIEEYARFNYEDKMRSSAVDKIIFDDLKLKGLLL